MKKYNKPTLMNESMVNKTKGLAPLAAVASLSVGGAALIGAALGLTGVKLTTGKEFKPKELQMALKPVIKTNI